MRVEFVRWIDFWVGVPLCFLASLVNALFVSPIRRRVSNSASEKSSIVMIELSEMGSAILAYPSMKYLQEKYSSSDLYFLTFEKNKESAEVLQGLEQMKVLTIDDSNLVVFMLSTLRVLVKLRQIGTEVTIDLETFSRFTALLGFLSGARIRVGFGNDQEEGLYRGNLINKRVKYNTHRSMPLNFLSLVNAIPSRDFGDVFIKEDLSPLVVEPPVLEISEKERVRVLADLGLSGIASKNLVLINPDPGPALPIRGWPIEYYIEFCQRILIKNANLKIGILGLSTSKVYAERVSSALNSESVIDLTGRTQSLRDVISLFHSSSFFLSTDSGLGHMASLSEIPSLVLFGPESPKLYAPLGKNVHILSRSLACSPCLTAANHRSTSCTNNICLKEISPRQVAQLFFEMTSNNSSQFIKPQGTLEDIHV